MSDGELLLLVFASDGQSDLAEGEVAIRGESDAGRFFLQRIQADAGGAFRELGGDRVGLGAVVLLSFLAFFVDLPRTMPSLSALRATFFLRRRR
jgi:hypothetical protein